MPEAPRKNNLNVVLLRTLLKQSTCPWVPIQIIRSWSTVTSLLVVLNLRYLGSIFTKDGRDPKNIRHGVTQAQKILSALNGAWWSKDVTKNRKKIVYDSMVKVS